VLQPPHNKQTERQKDVPRDRAEYSSQVPPPVQKKKQQKKSKRNSVTTVPYDAKMYFCQRSPAFLEQNKIKKVVSSDTTETTQIEIFDQEFSIDENLYCLFFQKNRLI